VNYRGSAGFGAKHRDAVKAGFDTVPIEDVRATVAWLVGRYPVHAKRVGLFGEGFGGYVALRAAQLFPDEFRCVVSINAPADVTDWFSESTMVRQQTLPDFNFEIRQAFFAHSQLSGRGVTEHVSARDRPVMII
jgi:dipeptidyl aminopeptidase/acylaminoacyl peptidase